jgi:hypothetical protein
MDVDTLNFNNVVDMATAGVLDGIRTPARRQRPPVMLPLMGRLAQPYVDFDGPLSEDPSSFDSSANVEEVIALRNANQTLRGRISALSKQYYQWKVATIFNANAGRQMALELKKIGMEYHEDNTRKFFGLTTWAHTGALYPDDMPVKPNSSNMDWSKLEFDHKNAMSSHDLQENPEQKRRKLWQKRAKWLLEG